jgi:exopolysaccharide/PEP-CTERM locus tyrosine autokinase
MVAPQAELLLDVEPLKATNPKFIIAPGQARVVIEEYRKLKSVILRMTQGGKFLNTIAITSGAPQDGKSLTALNLAFSLAQSYDHTVLLVDTDLRGPSIHSLLGIKPEKGLIHYLRDDVPLDEILVKTGLGKLVVLPAGGTVKDPVELLSSDKMRKLVEELKNRYLDRYVIFDTPPVTYFAESQAIASMVDGVLLVVRDRETKQQHFVEALSVLEGANIMGIVYNSDHAPFMKGSSYYYYYYYYY